MNSNTVLDLIQDCRNQLVYLNDKFGETGTSNALIARLTYYISMAEKSSTPCTDVRPMWLDGVTEWKIMKTYANGAKLLAVKTLWETAKENAHDDRYGLKWSKDYIEQYMVRYPDMMPKNADYLRPAWLEEYEEQEIIDIIRTGNKLQAVKTLYDYAKKSADDTLIDLKWCKQYVDYLSESRPTKERN